MSKLSKENLTEFVGQIVDVVEDFLESKGIQFPETKQLMLDAGCSEEEAEENTAILYGDNYDAIASLVEDIVLGWGLVQEDSRTEDEIFNQIDKDIDELTNREKTFALWLLLREYVNRIEIPEHPNTVDEYKEYIVNRDLYGQTKILIELLSYELWG